GMAETEWLACTDPMPMLEFLRGKASDRKLRLFACACCRRFWDEIAQRQSKDAIMVAELHADRQASDDELIQAETIAGAVNIPQGQLLYLATAALNSAMSSSAFPRTPEENRYCWNEAASHAAESASENTAYHSATRADAHGAGNEDDNTGYAAE